MVNRVPYSMEGGLNYDVLHWFGRLYMQVIPTSVEHFCHMKG